jgi:WD40 repeat protein
MKIKNIHWIYHGKNSKKRSSIFSLDFQPFGNLIVTAGQDSFIKIWERFYTFSNSNILAPNRRITKKPQNKQIKIPSFILESNIGHVNTIRWATSGCFFATGGDDGYLSIYEKVKNPYQKQMWRIFYTFKHHISDIIDLGWSPNNLFLASGSLDNSVLIWSVEKKTLIVKLMGHSSWIKGLSWSTTGKYLTTQGADKKIIIWRTKEWRIEKVLDFKNKKPGHSNEGKIDLFSRSSWSSCGEYLIVGNTSYKKKNSVLILGKSQNFVKTKFFFGEKFLLKIVSPNPRLFKFDFGNFICSYFSVGSTGGNLIVWNPIFSNPSFKILNLNKSQIVDISWCYFGYQILVGFLDGTVMNIKLNKIELGKKLKKKDHLDFLKIFFFKSESSKFFKKNLFLLRYFTRKEKFKKIKKLIDLILIYSNFKARLHGNFFKPKFQPKKNLKFVKKKTLNCIKKTSFLSKKKKKPIALFNNEFSRVMLQKGLIFLRKKKEKIINFTFVYGSRFLNSKHFSVRLWSHDFLSKNLVLLVKKRKYYLREKKGIRKKIIKYFSKPFFISIQENYLKIVECEGKTRIFITNCIFKFFDIGQNLFYYTSRFVKNIKMTIGLKKSSGLIGI